MENKKKNNNNKLTKERFYADELCHVSKKCQNNTIKNLILNV